MKGKKRRGAKRCGGRRKRRGGTTSKILGAIGSAGKILKKVGIGRQVKQARDIVGKGALRMLKSRMGM